jgi:hypothetical protein
MGLGHTINVPNKINMKLKLTINEDVFVADGTGIALTVFLGEDKITALSLASCEINSSGDRIHKSWVNDRALLTGEKVFIETVEDGVVTTPFVERLETLKSREEAKNTYCSNVLGLK